MKNNNMQRKKEQKERLWKHIYLIAKRERRSKNLADTIINKLKDEYGYSDKDMPGKGTIYKGLERNRDRWDVNDLDQAWSMGSFRDKDFPVEVVSRIISIQQLLRANERWLTRRRALWLGRLYPYTFPALESAFPNDSQQNEIRFLQIASFYSRLEQLSEIDNQEYPDTRYLDDIFIVKHDFSFEKYVKTWLMVYIRNSDGSSDLIKTTSKANRLISPQTEPGKLLNELKGLILSKAEGLDKDAEILAFVKAHSDMRKSVEKWLALSLRKDIV